MPNPLDQLSSAITRRLQLQAQRPITPEVLPEPNWELIMQRRRERREREAAEMSRIFDAPTSGLAAGRVPAGGGGGGGDIKSQLKAGFLRAGRRDLADMVDTPEFDIWVKQESGWNPNAISPANNQGKPNYGLFQFWAGHKWARPGFSPEEQAFLAATKFRLSPERIRNFAAQIRSRRYKGWG